MIIPRFSVRWLMALMALCAVLAFVVSLAVAGHDWAIALAAALGSLVLTMTLHVAGFCLSWGMAMVLGLMSRRNAAASPFAMHTAPPQVVQPEEAD